MAKENKKVKNSVLIDLFYEDGLRTGERSGEKKGIHQRYIAIRKNMPPRTRL